jgi:hypothetical protein
MFFIMFSLTSSGQAFNLQQTVIGHHPELFGLAPQPLAISFQGFSCK